MRNAVKLVLSLAVLGVTVASASAAPMHRPHLNTAMTTQNPPAASAFAQSSGARSGRVRESGAELYQDRGNVEAEGLAFTRI